MHAKSAVHHSQLFGIDFSSAPSAQKPIVVARGELGGAAVRLAGLQALPTLAAFRQWLDTAGPWLGAFDFPFGLPRELVQTLGWPEDWPTLMRHYAAQSRKDLREQFVAFCAARPVGAKFAHRACDLPAGSSPSMKWVNPPVAWMMHAGVPLLMDAGVHLAGLHPGDEQRIALEGYPGLLARELIGNTSYKSDTKAKQTPERLIARKELLDALEQGRSRLGLRLRLSHAQRDALVADAKGDQIDAVLCLMQAAWASQQAHWGMPPQVDPLEGWIVSALEPLPAKRRK